MSLSTSSHIPEHNLMDKGENEMTDFEPVKKKIWKAVEKADKQKFDKECDALMKKAAGDWWRIGWNIAPADLADFAKMLERTAKAAHREWIKAMRRGDAPPEDVSPGEGFALCAKLIREVLPSKKRRS